MNGKSFGFAHNLRPDGRSFGDIACDGQAKMVDCKNLVAPPTEQGEDMTRARWRQVCDLLQKALAGAAAAPFWLEPRG